MTARIATTAALAFAVVLCSSVREAHADYVFIPFIGGTFAGRTAFLTGRLEDLTGQLEAGGSQRPTFGGSAGWLSSGLLGIEGDFSYTPGMFQRDTERSPPGFIYDSTVITLSGNVIVAVPQSVTGYSLRPYVVGGVGLIQTHFNYDDVFTTVDDNSLGFSVGGGAIGFLTTRTGVRFEVRHFRTFDREPNEATLEVLPRLSFWRFTIGVVIRR